MKKPFLLAGLATLLAVPAFAQSEKTTMKEESTGAKTTTEVNVRDNGTVKTETETRTGRTKAGEVVNDAAQDTKMAGKKVAHGTEHVVKKAAVGTEHVAKKAVVGTKHAAKKTGHAVKKGADKTEAAVEKAVD